MSPVAAAAIAAAVVIIIAITAFLIWQRRRSEALRSRFGPEYDEAVRTLGSRQGAENALQARQRRMEKFQIRKLQPDERDRFADQWHRIQGEFVDDPIRAIHDADRVVSELMTARGYPMTDFDHRAEDLSVDHPHVVRNYRAAHDIALRRDQASTEDMRRGLVHYRDLFDELLEAHTTGPRRGL